MNIRSLHSLQRRGSLNESGRSCSLLCDQSNSALPPAVRQTNTHKSVRRPHKMPAREIRKTKASLQCGRLELSVLPISNSQLNDANNFVLVSSLQWDNHNIGKMESEVNEWMKHLYSALLCIVVHPKRFTIIWGGLSSTTTSVQHPLGWCDGSHRTTAPVRSPHTSYRWREERDRANQVDGDYWEAMIDKGQWREFGQDTGVISLLFTMSVMGFLMTTESQDLGLTSHPKDGALLTV